MSGELFRYVDFDKRQPHWSANLYFYTTWVGGHTYAMKHGYKGHMEDDLNKLRKNYKDEKTFGRVKLEWLEPESEWDIDWDKIDD
jgi:hypothetical protein